MSIVFFFCLFNLRGAYSFSKSQVPGAFFLFLLCLLCPPFSFNTLHATRTQPCVSNGFSNDHLSFRDRWATIKFTNPSIGQFKGSCDNTGPTMFEQGLWRRAGILSAAAGAGGAFRRLICAFCPERGSCKAKAAGNVFVL